jgi:cobalt-zinc-cadmium efflux system protein
MQNHNHSREKNIGFVALLNIAFAIIELVGGILTNSLAILSDALHDFGDSIVLTTAWIAEKKAKRPPDSKRTFGYQRISLFASLFSATVLIAGSLFILSEAVQRLFNPEPVHAVGMMWLAIIGIVFNTIGMLRLKRGESMNEKVLSWHLMEDVFGWTVVLIGAIVIQFTDNFLIDPIVTILFTLFILWGVTKNLREVYNILLQGVPAHINLKEIETALIALPGVKGIHDVHIWSLEGETDVFTGHVVVDDNLLREPDKTKANIKSVLTNHHIEHSTIELESEMSCSGVECITTNLDRH